jgi:bifunctional non-homologous end joining protein LigD
MAENQKADVWQSNREPKKAEMPVSNLDDLKKQGIKKAMPKSVKPMLCTLTKEVVPDDDYLYEVKWDGYRIISYIERQ